jgi:hypothetical protein
MSVDFGDISDIENVDDSFDMSSINDSMMNNTTQESVNFSDLDDSFNLDDSQEDANNINIDIDSSNDTTRESMNESSGGNKKKSKRTKKRRTMRKNRTRKIYRQKRIRVRKYTRKLNKKRRMTKRKRGGNVDVLGDSDFNPNLMDKEEKMRGGTRFGGNNIGANCNDPNFSIYNTNLLKMFPYKA